MKFIKLVLEDTQVVHGKPGVNSRAGILLKSNFQNVILDMGMGASPRDSLYHLDMCVRGAGSQPYLTSPKDVHPLKGFKGTLHITKCG